MPAKHQKIVIDLPGFEDNATKAAIASEIIDFIIKRTKKGKQIDGKSNFPEYSKEYKKSLDYANAGKKGRPVDLTLSGDMLDSLELLNIKGDKIEIGFEKGSEENARADGNIRGTYGQDKPNRKKARDFLGITEKDLEVILAKYDDPNRADRVLGTKRAAAHIASDILDEIDSEG